MGNRRGVVRNTFAKIQVLEENMTRIVIELDNVKGIVETEHDHLALCELLPLIKQAILGAGYVVDGDLQFVDEGGG